MTPTLRRWFTPAPDSATADSLRCGKSPWTDAVHLLWSSWIFITPLFGGGYDLEWAGYTLLTYPVFLVLYARTLLAPRRHSWHYAMAMVLMSLGLLRWFPSGLSYFVFGCVMLHIGKPAALWKYLAQVLGLNAVLAAVVVLIGYPWQVIAWMLPMTVVIGVIVNVERANEVRDAALRLSQDEVRRLAATAERERIGRDLHDLLGHTLSLITLKLELSRKLIDRDLVAARLEIAEAEKVARHALAEVRSAVTGIRAADLAAELAAARLLLESSGVSPAWPPPPALPPELERPLALVLREAVTNIARHAGASHAEVRFAVEDRQLRVRIVDNGRGGVGEHGNGRCGRGERVRALRGRLEIVSPPRGGTCLELRVPLAPVAAAPAPSPAPLPASVAALEPGA